MHAFDKREVFAALRERIAGRIDALTASQKAVQSGAVHPEARQEHPKDTRAIEAGYLARGLAERVETLRDEWKALELLPLRDFDDDDAAAPGALVTLLAQDGKETEIFLAPCGGGETLEVAGRHILVLTPRSPLGSAIAGRSAGQTVRATLPSGSWDADIERVR